ncbi:hypothetical protein ACRAWF_22730, partial [Streptomyces sp. L7]
AAGKVRGVYLPLQKRWFGELAATRDDPAAEAITALPRCLAKQGYRVRDEERLLLPRRQPPDDRLLSRLRPRRHHTRQRLRHLHAPGRSRTGARPSGAA